jgi:ABC-type multidrug transport system fused ATPase/permease subunit
MQGKRRILVLLYALVVLSVVLESVGIAFIYPIVDIIQDSVQLDFYRNKFSLWIPLVDKLNREKFLLCIIFGAALLFTVKNVLLILAGYWNMRVVSKLYCSWMNKVLQIYLNKPYSFFLDNQTGDLVQTNILQTQKASEAIRHLITLLGSVTAIIGVVIILCYMNFKVSLFLIALLVPVYYTSMKFSKSLMYGLGKRSVHLEQKGFDLTSETILGIKQVKVFCGEDYFKKRMKKIWDEYSRHLMHLRFLSIVPRPTLETLVVLCLLGFVYIFSDFDANGGSNIAMLALLLVGIFRIIPLASASSSLSMAIASQLPSVEIVANLLKENPELKKSLPSPTFKKIIEFQNISFAYKGLNFVLRDLSLKFKAENFYGIVGASGSGKSTVIDLLAGFFKPQKGKVLVDGMNLNDLDINSWLYQLGLVSQDAFIFSGTIEDNICFGIEIENRSKDRIKEAAKISQISEFIEQLPMGYQTLVGERGVDLSGGQRQRLAIARAMYLDLPILIFDEATSSLDSITAQKITNIFKKLRNQKTIIVVAHSISTVSSADWIYVLEGGSLVEEGTHEKLVQNRNLYSRLFAEQKLE